MDSSPNPQSEHQPSTVHFLDYWRVLYARKEIVIAVILLVVLTGIIITRQMPRVYAGVALIKIQRVHPGIDVFQQTYGGRFDPIFLVSQFEIIKSYPVIDKVVDALSLDKELGVAYGWTESAEQIKENAINLVQRSTELMIRRETDLIEIRVKLSRPEQPDGEAMRVASRIANSIASVFEEYTKAENKRNVESGLAALKDEIDIMSRHISKAEEELGVFRAEHGITLVSDIDSGVTAIRTQIGQISADSNRARILANIKKSRYERVVELSSDEAAVVLPILVNDKSLEPLIANKENLDIKLSTLRAAGLGTMHPEVVQSTVMLSEINAKLDQRVKDLKMGLKFDYEQAQSEHDFFAAQQVALENQERELSSGISVEYVNLSRDLAMTKERKTRFETILTEQSVSSKMPTTSVTMIEPARVPIKPLPISPNFALNVTLSIVVGIAFGVALAFFVEYLDTTIKGVDDIDKHLGATVVGVIPNKMRTLNKSNRDAGHSEIYRVIRMNLKSSQKLADGKMIAVTSASAGEGKSTTAFNLAFVSAEVGEKTLIIDADLHRPVQHKILDQSGDIGLANVVVGEATLDRAIRPSGFPNLDFLPAGQMSRFSIIGLVDTDEMRSLITEIKSRYDRIIMDTPPIIGVSDTAPLVRLADGVVQVIHHRKYPRGLCKRAHDIIVGMGGNLLGVVLNSVEAAHDSSSYYYKYQYYYYYNYHYANEDADAMEQAPTRRRRRSSGSSSAPNDNDAANG